ncbi:hypothetical protein ACFW04_000666 [Cataglyphis niger]
MEFTKPENPEQRIADPWIKKMQEISRRKREKWVSYKRNENEKLALDNVEETTGANKLTDDESITQLDPTILMTLAQSSISQDNASAKDLHDSSLLQSRDTNIDGSNRIDLGNIENPAAEIIQEMHVMPYHSRYKDYEISEIIEDLTDAGNTTVANNARSELEKDLSLISEINSHSKESISQESKTEHSSDNTRRNIKKSSNSDNNSEEAPEKEYPGQPNLSRNDKEKSSKRHDEKIVTTKLLTRKSKEERDDAGEKNMTGRPLNHGRLSSRWGMSILSPPKEFLENKFRPLHQKNKEHTEGKKDGRHLVGRSGTNVTSLPKEFLHDTLMHRTYGAKSLSVKPGSRSSQIKGFSDHQSLANPSHQNSQADSTQQLMIDNNKELTETLYEKIPNNFYPSRYLKLNWNNYRPYIDLNNRLLLRNLKFLTQALQSYIEQNM